MASAIFTPCSLTINNRGQTTISRLGIPTATLVALHMLSVSAPPAATTPDIGLADRTDREVP
jgi:hypothetical protein